MKALRVPSAVAALVVALAGPRLVAAQAYSFPSLQLPQTSIRDFTAAVVASRGPAALLQWREAINEHAHFLLEAGFGDPESRSKNLLTFAAGNAGYQLLLASDEQPLDLLLTAGIGIALGSGQKTVQVPVGASIGHRFETSGGTALTPYLHPRISFTRCTTCATSNINRETILDFDIGFNFEVSPRFALRASGSFSGSDRARRNDSFAFGINWRPVPLAR